MPFALLRFFSWINRFGALPRVERAFRGISSQTFVRRSLFGFAMDLDVSRSTAQQLLFLEGERFIEERFLLGRLLSEGMTVVDVGANIGYYLLLAEKHVGPSGRVICIEPSVENLPELRRNIEINAFRNVELFPVALGATDGETGLQSGINSGIAEAGDGAYQVPLRRLDHLVRERVDFLKIDVEGYEGQVLEGAEALFETHRPVLFLELHPHIVGTFGYSTKGILDRLARHYSKISLFEKKPALSLTAKVAVRYFGQEALHPVDDFSSYVARYDKGDIVHTFWAVCQP